MPSSPCMNCPPLLALVGPPAPQCWGEQRVRNTVDFPPVRYSYQYVSSISQSPRHTRAPPSIGGLGGPPSPLLHRRHESFDALEIDRGGRFAADFEAGTDDRAVREGEGVADGLLGDAAADE